MSTTFDKYAATREMSPWSLEYAESRLSWNAAINKVISTIEQRGLGVALSKLVDEDIRPLKDEEPGDAS